MRTKFLIALIIVTILVGVILIFAGLNPLIALIGGGITWFMVYFLWSPPSKHKEFSDADRIKATSRALGGSGPPDLWTPPMPGKNIIKPRERNEKSVPSKAYLLSDSFRQAHSMELPPVSRD